MEDTIIIGAGLSGMATAYQLKKQKIGFKILEAQNRLGGRIETILGNRTTPMDMGATWFGKEHRHLFQFLSELSVAYFEQCTEGITLFETTSFEPPQPYFVPANSHPSYRIKGGTYSIIEALHQHIGKENVVLNTEVTQVVDEGNSIQITDSVRNTFNCKHLIVAIPPKLLINTIRFSPALPQTIQQVMDKTQTWMSGSAKFSLEYNKPFWKENGFSGSVYSQSGLAIEIYDHSNSENTKFALMGFLDGSAAQYTYEERKEKVVTQLKHYFGNEALGFFSYHDKIWDDKYIQPNNEGFLPPHHNNGHPSLEGSYMNNKLFFTGTETSKLFGGYMEGAIIASNSVATKVLEMLKI